MEPIANLKIQCIYGNYSNDQVINRCNEPCTMAQSVCMKHRGIIDVDMLIKSNSNCTIQYVQSILDQFKQTHDMQVQLMLLIQLYDQLAINQLFVMKHQKFAQTIYDKLCEHANYVDFDVERYIRALHIKTLIKNNFIVQNHKISNRINKIINTHDDDYCIIGNKVQIQISL